VLLSTDMYTLIDDDAIVPFDGLASSAEDQAWLNSFYPAFMANSRTGGKTWGIPFQRSTIVLYWNKEMFKEAGLDPHRAPANWTDRANATHYSRNDHGYAARNTLTGAAATTSTVSANSASPSWRSRMNTSPARNWTDGTVRDSNPDSSNVTAYVPGASAEIGGADIVIRVIGRGFMSRVVFAGGRGAAVHVDARAGNLANAPEQRSLTRVIVTHMHPDHIGMAGWLTRRFDCRLWMTRLEYLTCRSLVADTGREAPDDAIRFYRRAGWGDEAIETYRVRFGGFGPWRPEWTLLRLPGQAAQPVRQAEAAGGQAGRGEIDFFLKTERFQLLPTHVQKIPRNSISFFYIVLLNLHLICFLLCFF
jgi:hypothetical protein